MNNITHIDTTGRRTRRQPAAVRLESGFTVGSDQAIRLRALRHLEAGLIGRLTAVQNEIQELVFDGIDGGAS